MSTATSTPAGRPPALAVVPVHVHDRAGLDAAVRRLVSLSCTAAEVPIIAAAGADSSPELLDALAVAADAVGGELLRSPASVLTAVNVGLAAARDADLDAVVVSGELELTQADWLDQLIARRDSRGRPAAIVGARLVFPAGRIAAAGQYFSLLTRDWQPRLRYAPADLPAAHVPCACPVDRLVLIRAATLADVGLLDEDLRDDHAELDLCLRAFAGGGEVVYEPRAVAVLHTPPEPDARRARATREAEQRSVDHLREKHRGTDFAPWTPEP